MSEKLNKGGVCLQVQIWVLLCLRCKMDIFSWWLSKKLD